MPFKFSYVHLPQIINSLLPFVKKKYQKSIICQALDLDHSCFTREEEEKNVTFIYFMHFLIVHQSNKVTIDKLINVIEESV